MVRLIGSLCLTSMQLGLSYNVIKRRSSLPNYFEILVTIKNSVHCIKLYRIYFRKGAKKLLNFLDVCVEEANLMRKDK